jgi:hypothetical protein
VCGEQQAAEYQTKLLWDKKIGTPSMMWACHCSMTSWAIRPTQ